MNEKKLGMPSIIATGVGLIVATSCLLSLGQGAGALGTGFAVSIILACFINILSALCMAELNAMMPNLTGGLAQYTLAGMGPFITIVTMVGGYLLCQSVAGSVECAMFGNTINSVFHTGIPSSVFCILLLVVLIAANLMGVDMFAKIQDVVAYGLILSLLVMGFMGIFGIGTGTQVQQQMNLATSASDYFSYLGLAFFLFIGCEFVIPLSPNVKNARKSIPLGMVLCLVIVCVMQIVMIFGMGRYTLWGDLAASSSPHVLYGTSLLGRAGAYWMVLVSIFAVVSTVNSCINFLSNMCAGMAKLNLMPESFTKQNKRGAHYPGILMIGGIMIVVNATGLSNSSSLSFMILVAMVFWMVSYVMQDINVLIFRRKFPKMPRTFKVPFGPLIPVVAIIGNVFMIFHIDGDPAVRAQIFRLDGILFVVLAVYAALWCKYRLKRPLFQPYEIKEVMAMENELYIPAHKRWEEKQKAAGKMAKTASAR